MAKVKREKKENQVTVSVADLELLNRRTTAMNMVAAKNYEIVKADIKDDFCNYNFQLISGPGAGAVHKVTDSTHIIEDSLRKVFLRFRVHLAIITGAFTDAKVEIDDIEKFNEDDITELFSVSGFEISGTEDAEKIRLVGTKYVGVSRGRVEIKTHKVPMDNLGGYQWYNELKQAADDARLEVALYKEGFYVPVAEEEQEDPNQLKMGFEEENAEMKEAELNLESGKV